MNKEIIAEKEINPSHDLSSKINVRKEKLELREEQYTKTALSAVNLKRA